VGDDGVAAPLSRGSMPDGFRLLRETRYGADTCSEWVRDS
jgi:diaminohydroxyphosphoribosylaminopyrimidine deaminase/5-amino-6-(5-phosphoribosylamino)uracil reductase